MKIILYCSSIINNDAIGNDILIQYQYLQNFGFETVLFAYGSDKNTQKLLISEKEFIASIQDKSNILLIHFGAFWSELIKHINLAKCTIIFKYHNITPSHFYEKYSIDLQKHLDNSRHQLLEILHLSRIDYYWADSHYNAEELIGNNVPESLITIIPPFHKVLDFTTTTTNEALYNQLSDGSFNLLFVGRVAPNKGHIHLIETIKSYKRIYGNNVHLHIVGSIACELQPYYKKLKQLIKQYQLNDMITFHEHVSFPELNTFYKCTDIFLLMSEHEGFCVPILEAQYHNIPILALDRAAIKETIGPAQLVYEKVDYDLFAAAIYTLKNNQEIRFYLTREGYSNFLKYESSTIAKHMLSTIQKIIDEKIKQ
ncbi:MAG: glycosyltransferase [Sulfuricurvum sp.]